MYTISRKKTLSFIVGYEKIQNKRIKKKTEELKEQIIHLKSRVRKKNFTSLRCEYHDLNRIKKKKHVLKVEGEG